MASNRKIAFIFPGQGAQYPGMAKDFYEHLSGRQAHFQEADDILGRKLSSLIFEGPEDKLTETKNSQLGIFVASTAILASLHRYFPSLNLSCAPALV